MELVAARQPGVGVVEAVALERIGCLDEHQRKIGHRLDHRVANGAGGVVHRTNLSVAVGRWVTAR